MRLLLLFPALLLASLTTAGPISNDNNLVITKDFFIAENVKYTSQHDIVHLLLPLNKILFDDDTKKENDRITLFFVEADTKDNGELDYKGISVVKDRKARKVLANGKTATAFNDDGKIVYIGATDGIYLYNGADNSTTKYGTITDDIAQIEADNRTGLVYFLTGHQLFSLVDEGTKKNKVENVNNVVEFAIDFISNIYYYDTNKDIYVFNQNGIKKFEVTTKPNEIKLLGPLLGLEEGTSVVIDNSVYFLWSNGTIEFTEITLQLKPTAYAPKATILQYYAHDKKIYEFDILKIQLRYIFPELIEFLESHKTKINELDTTSRKSFGA